MKKFLLLFTFIFQLSSFNLTNAQVTVNQSIKQTGKDELTITFVANISSGWHIYAPGEQNCPAPVSFNIDKIEGAKVMGSIKANKAPQKKFDNAFGAEVSYYEGTVTFTQKAKITGKRYKIQGYFEYSACNATRCSPPTDKDFSFSGKGIEGSEEDTQELSKSETQETDKAVDTVGKPEVNTANVDTAGVVAAAPLEEHGSSDGLLSLFLMGILGGFIALLTPCVWPIIPMTVSFFLKRAKDNRKKGIMDACIYGISIIVIYVALGLIVTLLFGASALNALSTSAVFNIFFFLLLVVFGASFLGGFEIVLPSSWTNAVDTKASSLSSLNSQLSTLGSIFLMAFTLSLVSFSCTGPIIGFLLVEVGTSGNIIGPAVGMFGFALALALPFTLFAIFPSWLKSVPKSGNWMNNVKVTLGFIELAFSLKFLSVADLAYGWHILDREVFLSLWIVLFFLLGCYLIGWIRFPHDVDSTSSPTKTTVIRFFVALCSFAFALYMVPGLWGAPCTAISAFAPPMETQDFVMNQRSSAHSTFNTQQPTKYTDYEEGMKAAKAAHKPVMLDFTGFGCVNCRKMEAAVLSDEEVRNIIKKDYILIELYVDDKTPLPETQEVQENGETIKLRTVGDKWSYLQRTKYGSNTQPFYVLVDEEGKMLAQPYSYDEDKDKFIDFLSSARKKYGE